jgi:hypothetical protein
MAPPSARKTIVVAGDCTIDWYLARVHTSERAGALGDPLFETAVFRQPGGALLLGRLIKEIGRNLKAKYLVLANDLPEEESPRLGGYWHSFTICAEFAAKHQVGQKTAWRIDEFLGSSQRLETGGPEKHSALHELSEDNGNANIVLIDFLGTQNFSRNPDLWPKSLKSAGDAWVLLSWSRPNFSRDKDFVTQLQEKFADRIVAVVTLNDLRLCDMQISRGLSWERTAQDIVREMDKRREFGGFTCVIVSLDTEGAVVLSKAGNGKWDSKLYYDPKFIEGSWAEAYPGTMWGHRQCLIAGIALQMIHAGEFPKEWRRGVRSGLSAARKLHQDGLKATWDSEERLNDLGFPVADIVHHLIQQQASHDGIRKGDIAESVTDVLKIETVRSPFVEETIPEPSGSDAGLDAYWTILAKRGRSDKKRSKLTREIVANGYTVLESKAPIGRFSDLFTVDRKEIESLRSISALISEYDYLRTLNRPLSIGVFGSPGSGKSFAIKCVTKALSLGGAIAELEFNLSQFGKAEDLFGALHQVRDVGLSGKLPLVFWDEFDTTFENRSLGWLQYFLAPMQDAKFHVGQLTHFIGRAIFVLRAARVQQWKILRPER